jgi:hypothetical protein
MAELPLAAVDKQSHFYVLGELVGWIAIALVVAWAVRKAIQQRRVRVEADHLHRENQTRWQEQLASPVHGRVVYDDGRQEGLRASRAQLPDVLMRLGDRSNAVVEIPDGDRGSLRIAIDRGTAMLFWDGIGGPFRFVGPYGAAFAAQDPDGRYRLNIADAITVVQAWLDKDTSRFGSWDRPLA